MEQAAFVHSPLVSMPPIRSYACVYLFWNKDGYRFLHRFTVLEHILVSCNRFLLFHLTPACRFHRSAAVSPAFLFSTRFVVSFYSHLPFWVPTFSCVLTCSTTCFSFSTISWRFLVSATPFIIYVFILFSLCHPYLDFVSALFVSLFSRIFWNFLSPFSLQNSAILLFHRLTTATAFLPLSYRSFILGCFTHFRFHLYLYRFSLC